jgi:Ca2+-transporting ATPase
MGIAVFGLIISFSVLGSLAIGLRWLGLPKKQAVTISFLTLAFAQLWHVFNMRDFKSSFLANDITRNPFIWIALAICAGLLLSAVYVPAFAMVLDIVHPGLNGWAVIISMSLIPWAAGQILKSIPGKTKSGTYAR